MQTLQNMLRKHKTTRHLSRCTKEVQSDLNEELREELSQQQEVVSLLMKYCETVMPALDTLAGAHAALMRGGIDRVDCVAPLARSLVEGLADAQKVINDAIVGSEKMLSGLNTHLVDCAEKVKVADETAGELSRYTHKMDSLSKNDHPGKKDRKRRSRNDEKLQSALLAASAAHVRGNESLRRVASRKEKLWELARTLIGAMANGLKQVSESLPRADRPSHPSHPSHPSQYVVRPAEHRYSSCPTRCAVSLYSKRLAEETHTPSSDTKCLKTGADSFDEVLFQSRHVLTRSSKTVSFNQDVEFKFIASCLAKQDNTVHIMN